LQQNGDSGIHPTVAEPEENSVAKSPDSLTHPLYNTIHQSHMYTVKSA